MKYRALVIFPLVVAAAYVALDQVFAGSASYTTFMRVEVEAVKAMALVGALIAAFRFRPADYLFRAWVFTAGCVFLLLVRDSMLLFTFSSLATARAVTVTAANVSQVIGVFFLARAWRVAGLDHGDHKGARLVVVAILVAAATLALPGIYFELASVRSGNIDDVALVASGTADLASLILIAPILFTALALRGGLLGWPWGLFAASMLAWVSYDAATALGPHVGLPIAAGSFGHMLAELFRGLGCTLTLSAGLAQRWVVDAARDGEAKKAA